MTYSQRLATKDDISELAPLFQAFAQYRSQVDSSMELIPDFDYEQYLSHQLDQPLSFCFVLEYDNNIVGFLAIYIYDEAPPSNLPPDIDIIETIDSPFKPRRVGAVLGLYVQEQHRKVETIKSLIEEATKKAESFKITDIDILVSQDQTGIHALLERLGFTKSAIQYTKHYQITDINLPNLHTDYSKIDHNSVSAIAPPIPFKDPVTNQVIKNLQGKPVYLEPIKDSNGVILKTSKGFPIYPMPLLDPLTKNWLFDKLGNLVVCPILTNEDGQVVEDNGMPKFKKPSYEYQDGTFILKLDENGNYIFT